MSCLEKAPRSSAEPYDLFIACSPFLHPVRKHVEQRAAYGETEDVDLAYAAGVYGHEGADHRNGETHGPDEIPVKRGLRVGLFVGVPFRDEFSGHETVLDDAVYDRVLASVESDCIFS